MPHWNSTTRSNWRPCEAQTKRIGLCANKAHVKIGDKVYCHLHARKLTGDKMLARPIDG